jgi:hypothetical protein
MVAVNIDENTVTFAGWSEVWGGDDRTSNDEFHINARLQ